MLNCAELSKDFYCLNSTMNSVELIEHTLPTYCPPGNWHGKEEGEKGRFGVWQVQPCAEGSSCEAFLAHWTQRLNHPD